MKARDIIKQKTILENLNRLSEEDLRNYVLYVESKNHKEVMDALAAQHDLISNIAKKVERQNWYVDFGSDLLANFTTDTLIWLGRKIFK